MILDTLITKSCPKLKEYLRTRPRRQFTMLDCHDGIPVKPDLDDLLSTSDARKLVDTCVRRGANLSLILSERHKDPDGFDVHQIRCTYYSALGCDDDAYLAARAIQFFAPGIPQVYYVGLLAGENDLEAVKLTGEGREINRHNFSVAEIGHAVRKDVVKRLLRLIRFRNEYEAFDGEFEVLGSAADEIRLSWRKGKKRCTLTVDLKTNKSAIEYLDDSSEPARYPV
jgi:sucrose phosphorylase